jgi:hypothetical protein
MSKQSILQKKDYSRFNSYVTDAPLHELQFDLADFTKSASDNNGFRYLMVGIDVFSKFVYAIPLKTKLTDENLNAFNEIIKHIGVPKQVMMDSEGAWTSRQFATLLSTYKTKQILTTSPAPFVERVIGTLKHMIMTRVEALHMAHEEWVKLLPAVLKKYNSTIHNTTGVSPENGRLRQNKLEVYINIRNKAQFKRTYEKIEIGDSVRTRIKKHTFKKGFHSTWSDEFYKVLHVNNGQYMIDDKNRSLLFNRHDL